ncbi:DUF397 domain-containing protein [Actinomadura sp. NEAU-AAG7]|uniref:DUF397 domain-containing protein n=1 Tax=Actinomadura sp. NEAU-AAG7 TaxID=2839640 RepID=UPI001BE49559|nr:DUF397 domain-containing protein [Actinomadura sp. NEAU-AAG7]MBT2210475.1 DUF397 domain-containing protein [Actinomadura sp. NEAU-AAG7]
MTEQVAEARWRTSSYTEGQDCVELASLGGLIRFRDSKAPQAPHLGISRDALACLLGRIKSGNHDL